MKFGQKIFYIVTGVIVILIISVILALSTTNKSTKPNTTAPIPTPFVGEAVKPVVNYDEGSLQKSAERIKNPGELSQQDKQVRKSLLDRVGNKSGILFEYSTFRITYMQTFDFFESEILTTNVSQAKSDTLAWLKQQGLSENGVCHLPLTFFLNNDVAKKITDPFVSFNPNPDGC